VFDAGVYRLKAEAERSYAQATKVGPVAITSDAALQKLMLEPPGRFFGKQEAEDKLEDVALLNPVTRRARRRQLRKRRKVAHTLRTDVFEVRQCLRHACRSMPHLHFVSLVAFLLRGALSIKQSADSGSGLMTYWHEDDPSFKHQMGQKETNQYTRQLLVAMGFVKLSDRYWIWPQVHLREAYRSESRWGDAEVPDGCPGKDPHRLGDLIILLKSCKMSLRKSGNAFTGFFPIQH